jgi:hypothetical protein
MLQTDVKFSTHVILMDTQATTVLTSPLKILQCTKVETQMSSFHYNKVSIFSTMAQSTGKQVTAALKSTNTFFSEKRTYLSINCLQFASGKSEHPHLDK